MPLCCFFEKSQKIFKLQQYEAENIQLYKAEAGEVLASHFCLEHTIFADDFSSD